MRVELDADHRLRTDHAADMLQQVGFAVVIVLRHHRAVQAEHHGIDGQRCTKLRQDLLTHPLIGAAAGHPAWHGPEAGTRDEFVPVGRRTATGHPEGGRLHGRLSRMLARPPGLLVQEVPVARRHRREGIGFQGQTSGEDAHGESSGGDTRRGMIPGHRPDIP